LVGYKFSVVWFGLGGLFTGSFPDHLIMGRNLFV